MGWVLFCQIVLLLVVLTICVNSIIKTSQDIVVEKKGDNETIISASSTDS